MSGNETGSEALRLKNQLCFPLYICSKEITRKYTELLNELDLTYTQYVVMMYFWEHGSSSVKQAGDILMLDSSTLTPVLKKLESKGFLKRERSTEDERVLNVTLTDEGSRLREKASCIPEKMKMCYGLTGGECDELYRLVTKLLNNIVNNRQEEEK